jgi:integrase
LLAVIDNNICVAYLYSIEARKKDMKTLYLVKREDIYYYRRVVPLALRSKFSKRVFMFSLKTRDKNEALRLCARENERYEAILSDSPNIVHDDGPCSYSRSVDVAPSLGIEYLPIDFSGQVKKSDLFEQIAVRLEALQNFQHLTKEQVATLAGVARPCLTFRDICERYQALTEDRWMHLSRRERDKKLRPIDEAVADFIKVMGDTDVLKITKADVYKYRDSLVQRIKGGLIKTDTANKKLGHLRKIITRVFEVDFDEMKNPFDGARVEKAPPDKRPPFTEDEIVAIRNRVLTSDSNDELKAIIMIGMNTGASPKEIVLLDPTTDIIIDAEIPHIRIGPNRNRKKVKSGGARHREIPLIGEALEWAKRFQGGFTRYSRDNGSEAVSAAANKLISSVTTKTFYSFRHRIADRLRNIGVADSLRDAIMGHAVRGMNGYYGLGYSLEMKRDALLTALLTTT